MLLETTTQRALMIRVGLVSKRIKPYGGFYCTIQPQLTTRDRLWESSCPYRDDIAAYFYTFLRF